MAIPSDPDRSRIHDEFSGDLRSTFTNESLKQMYGQATDTDGSGYSRDYFGGKGQPEIPQPTGTGEVFDVNEANLVVTFTEDWGGLGDGFARVEYHEDDGQIPFSGQTTFTTNFTAFSNDGASAEITVNGLDYNTEYHFRIQAYNNFATSSNPALSDYNSTTIGDPPQWDTPAITTSSADLSGFSAEWNQFDQFGGKQPDSFEARFRVNGGSWNTPTLDSSSNWNTSTNPKTGEWSYAGQIPQFGDDVDFEIRAEADGDANASEWSTTQSFTV